MVGSILSWLGVVVIYAVIFVGFVDAYGGDLTELFIVIGTSFCIIGSIWMAFEVAKVLKGKK